MLSFIFLNNFFRRNTGKSPCLPPGASSIDHIRLWNDVEPVEPPEAHDTSYVDALCDAHARRRLQSEFANIKPSSPAAIYNKVLLAIDDTPASRPEVTRPSFKPTFGLSALFAQLYKAFSGPATSRIVPSGVAVLLALSILTPNLSRMLRGEPAGQSLALNPVISLPSEAPATGGEGLSLRKLSLLEGPSDSATRFTGPAVAEDPAIDENRLSRALPPLKQALRLQAVQDRYEYINRAAVPE